MIRSLGKINRKEHLPWSKKEILETIYSDQLNTDLRLIKKLKIISKILLVNSQKFVLKFKQKLKNH